MLDGSFHGLTEAQILDRLLARPRPDDADAGTTSTGSADAGSSSDGGSAQGEPADETRTEIGPAAAVGVGVGVGETGPVEAGVSEEPTGDGAAGTRPPGSGAAGPDRWWGERVGIREGVELRVGLATVLGCDQRPAEIPGLGPIDPEIARAAVTRQRRGARWRFAVVDPHGYLLLAGPLRRRPRPSHPPSAGPPDRVRGGVVELHLTLAELRRFAADPDLAGDWAGIIAEVADRWADRHRLWQELAKDPRARFARGALADHVRIRDRTCVGPCCDRSARRSDLDHTRDHAHGGPTLEHNLGPSCRRHHPDKDRGWTLIQPRPGHFVWVSPLGRTYHTRGEPIRPELPEPEPPPDGTDQREDPDINRRGPPDQHIRWRKGRNPAPPPPPAQDTEEEPP